MSKIKREVLNAFKKLHRSRQLIFAGDEFALEAGRKEINARFKQNMAETNPESIKKMVQLALDADKELRSNVIQAKKTAENVYVLRITPDVTRLDNFPFNPDAVIPPPNRSKKKSATVSDNSGVSNDKATPVK